MGWGVTNVVAGGIVATCGALETTALMVTSRKRIWCSYAMATMQYETRKMVKNET